MRNPVSEPVSTPLLDVDIVQPYPLLGDTSDAANGWEEDDDSLSFTSLELPTGTYANQTVNKYSVIFIL